MPFCTLKVRDTEILTVDTAAVVTRLITKIVSTTVVEETTRVIMIIDGIMITGDAVITVDLNTMAEM